VRPWLRLRCCLPLLVVATVPALTNCADFTGNTDPAAGLPDVAIANPVFSQHVLPVFERRCAIGGCHSILSKRAGLVLVRDSAHTAIVGQPSRLRDGEVLVRPGNAEESWLVILLEDDAARRRDVLRMPLGSGSLTPNQITTIRNWIDQGAVRQ
jgi:hypothetical protein